MTQGRKKLPAGIRKETLRLGLEKHYIENLRKQSQIVGVSIERFAAQKLRNYCDDSKSLEEVKEEEMERLQKENDKSLLREKKAQERYLKKMRMLKNG